MARVLIACEYSGRVRDAFIRAGHDAISCDLLPSETPGPHHQGDVLEIIGAGFDLMIAHPECTYLTGAAEWAYGPGPYHQKVKPGTLTGAAREAAREKAIAFALALWNCGIPRIAIENPVGVLTKYLGKPQIVQPHEFGDDASKKTCLHLLNLPRLQKTRYVEPRMIGGRPRWANQTDSGQNRLSPGPDRWKERSRTFQGIADAMSDQWGRVLTEGAPPASGEPRDLFSFAL